MAVVAQLVEPRVVISVVVGSSPISRPNFFDVPLVLFFLVLFAISYLLLISTLSFKTLASFGNFLRLPFLFLSSKDCSLIFYVPSNANYLYRLYACKPYDNIGMSCIKDSKSWIHE